MIEYKDHEIDFVIPKERGIGIKFEEDGCKCITICEDKGLRSVELDISSYVGLCAEAIHSYGNLKVRDLGFKVLAIKNKKHPYRKVGHSYGGCNKDCPKDMNGIKIELTRPVTEADKRLKDGERYIFEHWLVGWNTDRFNSDEEVIEKAKEVFNKSFGKGWKLVIQKQREIIDKEHGACWEDYWETLAINK